MAAQSQALRTIAIKAKIDKSQENSLGLLNEQYITHLVNRILNNILEMTNLRTRRAVVVPMHFLRFSMISTRL